MAEIRYSESIEINAPIEKIFDYRLDFTKLPDYNPTVSNLLQKSETEYEFDLLFTGAGEPLRTPLRITHAQRPTHIVFDTGPDYIATEDCTFEQRGRTTAVTFAYVVRIPGELDEATVQAIEGPGREQARMELENMRVILEGSPR